MGDEMSLDITSVRDDIAAFADDDNDVIIEPNGQLLFVRSGKDITCRLIENDSGSLMVSFEGTIIPYRKFLSHYLARLDVFAQKILSKRPGVQAFVNGPAQLDSISQESQDGDALTLLNHECTNISPFTSRVAFITADAGHGKTALLKEYQVRQAEKFYTGKSNFLFWHVDLQGRQLLRLSEALMGDLGDLRVTGIYMPSVIRLLRHRVLVLAIDGFDELAAEQGSTDALGALALLVQQMQDKGTIIAASRRTFFDTDDYLKRAGIFRRGATSQCEFDQIHIKDWERKEGVKHLSSFQLDGQGFEQPEMIYDEILTELGGQTGHPMVARPFLLSHIAKGLLMFNLAPSEFIRGMQDPMEGVASVVKAFVKREVKEKWKAKETGEPYLTSEQHLRLLADVAEEMWLAQRDRLELEVIETITMLLLEEWQIAASRKQQVLDMVKMHVLLIIPAEGAANVRGFDHPEFRDYFVAQALAEKIKGVIKGNSSEPLGRFLAHAQLPDAVARYSSAIIDKQQFSIRRILDALAELVAKEWRPTFLQTNVGTLVPFLLNGYIPDLTLVFNAKVIYSSLIFENTTLRNLEIHTGHFINASFIGVNWHQVRFVNCEFDEVIFERTSTYEDVILDNCRINGIKLNENNNEVRREYAPIRIAQLLKSLGIQIIGDSQIPEVIPAVMEGKKRRLTRRFLRTFRRTTAISEEIIKFKFHGDLGAIRNNIIPLMEQHGLIEKQQGGTQDIWLLTKSLEEILRADGGNGEQSLIRFWREIDSD